MSQKASAQRILMKMFKEQEDDPSNYFSCGLINDNVFKWRVTIIGQPGSELEGGMFPAEVEFPDDFPNRPPKMRFLCPMWHPNIDGETGKVCISILHDPGNDPYEYEQVHERWLPIHNIESIVVSVVSMLTDDPNCESPLNVEAARQYKHDRAEYNKKVRRLIQRSIEYC